MKHTNLIIYWQHRLEYVVIGIALSILAVIAVSFVLRFALQLLNWRRLRSRNMVGLALTPPAFANRSAYSNEKLFDVIAGQRSGRPLKDKLLLRDITMPFFIGSTKSEGIRFTAHIEERYAGAVAQNVMSSLPEVKVAAINTDLVIPDNARIIEFKQTGDWWFPLMDHVNLEQHDPVGFLAGVMGKLEAEEVIGLQVIATPTRIRKASEIAARVMRNEEVLTGGPKTAVSSKLFQMLNTVMFGVMDLIGEIFHSSSSYSTSPAQRGYYDQLQIAKRLKPARVLSSFEQERHQRVQDKVCSQLFRVSIRVMVNMDNDKTTRSRLSAITASLASYDDPGYQGLRPRWNLPLMDRYRHFVYRHGLPSLLKRHSCILSSAELASLYHFPIGETAKVDNLSTSLSRTLPAPVSLKSGRKLAVLIGDNHHQSTTIPIGLTGPERERHLYIIGGTGNGKTTMLFYSILQDIRAGNGIAVLDPHGDLAERILRYIPEDRVQDVIYMNPDDLSYPIGVNLLELPEGLTGDDLLREKDLVTEATISVLRKIFSDDDSGGHRIEYILRNSIQTALTLESPTLFTIFDLLNNAKYRRKVVKTLTDQNLKDFWDNELGKAGEFQRVKMAAGITAKIGRFLFSASARRVLEQPKSTIDFEDILASKKILIANFSKGLLGEDTSTLFGTTILAKLQTAALRRARIGEQNRLPFYLYVDEFQNFATMSFVQMLSEARKYKLFLTMAEQSTSQQDQQRLVDIILANVGTIVCFRTGSPADEKLVLPLFSPFIRQGEIANLPAYSYYVRIAALDAQEPMSGMTVVVENEGSETIAKRVIESSHALYAKEVTEEKTDLVKAPIIAKAQRSQPIAKQSSTFKTEVSLK
jgi:hypothetical protein